jgi:glycosyltransferase involved in cell wall biosynthesis
MAYLVLACPQQELFKMTAPLVSIKMITYNHAPYIAQAIEGVLQQKTTFPFELVIGEDCSTDGTREIVFEYQKKYPNIIRVITSEKNVGMKRNGLRVLKACHGKYIAFCEGDDYWQHPLKLQKQADYLENHPEYGLVYSSYDVYHVKIMKRIKDFIKYKKWEMPKSASIHDVVENRGGISLGILTCTVMVRRTLYNQIVESDPYIHQNDKFLMGDTPLWAEIATRAQLHYIPESLATHNLMEESATRSKDIKKVLRFQISCAEAMLYLCNKHNLPLRIKNYHEQSWCNASLRLAFHARNAELADEVRRRKKTFTWKEWFKYYGSKNAGFYYVHRVASLFLAPFRNDDSQWL